MKLIDILVQELPKRGGWPVEAACITQDDDRALCLWKNSNVECVGNYWRHPTGGGLVRYFPGNQVVAKSNDHVTTIVTREQYEAALKQPVWDGTGLPPVGVECERQWCGDEWLPCTILFVSDETVVVKLKTREASYGRCEVAFRPIRSEVDKKRDEAIHEIASMIGRGTFYEDAERIYDAITSGALKLSD